MSWHATLVFVHAYFPPSPQSVSLTVLDCGFGFELHIVLSTFYFYFLHHLRWKRLCFHPFLSVCLCTEYLKKFYVWIRMKLGGHVGCVTRKNWFSFGEDPDLDLIIFSVILHHWVIGLNQYPSIHPLGPSSVQSVVLPKQSPWLLGTILDRSPLRHRIPASWHSFCRPRKDDR